MGGFAPFVPMYVLPGELTQFGLPSTVQQPDIYNLVQMASLLIDEWCGRIDSDGNGSLVYTTYTSRILLQTRNRNLIQLPIRPIVGLSAATIAALQAMAPSGSSGNYFYTGAVASTLQNYTGQLSGIVAASGRYGYTRQDMSVAYPDLQALINPLNLVTLFGGPAPWVAIDITNTDYDTHSGEVWIPAGLQLQRYAEVLISWNSGFDPRAMPMQIKFATASVVKNAMAKGDATTAMLSFSMRGGPNYSLSAQLIDPTIDNLLTPWKQVRGY